MTHKYNIGDTVWVASLDEHTAPFPMTITDIRINNENVYYDGYDAFLNINGKVTNKPENLLHSTREDCIEFTNKNILDNYLRQRNMLLYELERVDSRIKYYEDLINESKS